MAECKIMKCSCKHEGQDQMYGPGMRVFNPIGKGSQDAGYICTVCGNKTGGSSSKAKK